MQGEYGLAEPAPDQCVWEGLEFSAGAIVRSMRRLRRSDTPERRSKEELLVIGEVVRLDQQCDRILDKTAAPQVLPISSSAADPTVRYEIESAINMIPALVPLSNVTRPGMQAWLEDPDYEAFHHRLLESPDRLIEWRRWLWDQGRYGHGNEHSSDDYGRSSELYVACLALKRNIQAPLISPDPEITGHKD